MPGVGAIACMQVETGKVMITEMHKVATMQCTLVRALFGAKYAMINKASNSVDQDR